MSSGFVYSFLTRWEFDAPLERVWGIIFDADGWPSWWKGVERVELLRPAQGPHEVGAVRRLTWKSFLPYRLTFDTMITAVEPLRFIESTVTGELEGTGRWTFSPDGGRTAVRYEWNVRTTKRWMNILAPPARPLFRWNHEVIMRWGCEGIVRLLADPS